MKKRRHRKKEEEEVKVKVAPAEAQKEGDRLSKSKGSLLGIFRAPQFCPVSWTGKESASASLMGPVRMPR